jgi:hypothetical protein
MILFIFNGIEYMFAQVNIMIILGIFGRQLMHKVPNFSSRYQTKPASRKGNHNAISEGLSNHTYIKNSTFFEAITEGLSLTKQSSKFKNGS